MSLQDTAIPTALLDELERIYPQRCICEGETYEEHLRYAGAAGLVAKLRQIHDRRFTGVHIA